MSRPITWQNVNAPTSDPLQALALAHGIGRSVFSGLNDQIKQYENTSDANWKQVRDNNTQAFLSEINKYRTPEEYQAALASGALDTSKYGAQINQAEIRTALDGRLAILQDRAIKANQFTDQQQERDARPIVDRLNVMALSEDKDLRDSAKKALPVYMDSGMLPKGADLAGKIRDTEHQNTVWDRDTVKFDREGKKLDSDLLTDAARRSLMADQGAQARASANHLNTESSSATTTLKAQNAALKDQNAAAELVIKNGPLDAGHMGTYEGKMKFLDGIKKLGVPADEAESVYKQFSSSFGGGVAVDGPVDKDGKKTKVSIDLPVSVALSAVEAAGGDSWWPQMLGASSRGERASKHVGRLMADPAIANGINAAMEAQLIQYRPLTKSGEDASSVSVKTNSRTSSRSVLPKPSDELDASGIAVVNRVIEARAEKAKSMMTPEEIEAAKQGKLPFRIKRMLEAQNER